MSEESILAALRGVPPPEGDSAASAVYGIVFKLAESYQRETARRRGLEAVKSFLEHFGQGGLSGDDVRRLQGKVEEALAAGPPVPGTGDLRAPEQVVEMMLWEIRALREQLQGNQTVLDGILQGIAAVPPELFDQAFPALALTSVNALAEGNRRLLVAETTRELLAGMDDVRMKRVLVDVYGSGNPPAAAAAAPGPTLPADALAQVQRVEAAWLRVMAAAADLANVDTHEDVATRLSILNLAIVVCKEEIHLVTGDEGRLAAFLVISLGKEIRALREGMKNARSALKLMIPGSPQLQKARTSTLQLLNTMLDAPSVLEQPSFKHMVDRAGTDGRATGGICPVHGKVRADHSCLAYRPEGEEETA